MLETGQVSEDSAAYWHALLFINDGEFNRALDVPHPAKPRRSAFDALRALALAEVGLTEDSTDTLHSIAKDYFVSHYDMGRACVTLNSFHTALEWFDKVKREDQRPVALEATADVFLRAGKFDEAGECYMSAVIHQPFIDRRLIERASYAYRLAENDDAAERLERLVREA